MARTATVITLGVVVLATVAVAAWWWRADHVVVEPPAEPSGPEIPAPHRIDQLDPEIARLVRQALGRVAEAPGDASRWRGLAVIYDANALDDLAIRCYGRVLELNPNDVRSWYDQAVSLGEAGRFDLALGSMARAVSLQGGHAPAHWRMGLWRLGQGDLDRAEAAFEAAAAADPTDPVATIGLARVALQRGRWSDARRLLRPIADGKGPNAPYARQLLARAVLRLGLADEARTLAMSGMGAGLVREDPWRQEVIKGRAGLSTRLRTVKRLSTAGRNDEALALIEQLRSAYAGEVAVLTAIGTSYRTMGRLDESAELLGEAVEERPSYYPARLELARTLAARSRRQPGRAAADRAGALDQVAHAIRLNPSLAVAHALRGDILLTGGLNADAAAAFGEALRCDPTSPTFAYRAGLANLRMSRWTAAADAFETATGLDPLAAPAFHMLGVARMNLGRFDLAEQALRRAVNLAPTNRDFQQTLRRLQSGRAAP